MNHRMLIHAGAAALVVAFHAAAAQNAPAPAYPVPPRPLPEADEIALARSAAPDEISAHADVFVMRGTAFEKVRAGTNGCACMVGRDLHEGSRYPICFDQEGARTLLAREIMEVSLRAKGKSEPSVQREVAAAYASGALRMPVKTAVSYMMSPRQVLFSAADSTGVRVGPWSPHLMFLMPDVTPDQLGLKHDSKLDIITIHDRDTAHSELVVKVPKWSDGTPVVSAKP